MLKSLHIVLFTETPLTLAAHLDNMVEMITALKNGGAHLDFRSRDGMTPLHKAARAKNQTALKVSLFTFSLTLLYLMRCSYEHSTY